jgi:mannose-6-phosphate isomerase-like protein (cupin superfamily)
MDRRLFLQFPLLASLLSSGVVNAASPEADRPAKGFKVPADSDRFQEELMIMGGRFNRVVSSKDTEGDLCIYNTKRWEKGGPAFHLHHQQDEWFYVIKGEFIVKVGDDQFNLKEGDSAFAPRKTPHAFAKISEGEAQMLVLFQPAGTMEEFFQEMSKLGNNIPKDQESKLKELWRNHGMEIVGPPLKF